MRKEIADLWTAALRSGKYKQTRGFLKTEEGFCCLGVLCELAVESNIIKGPTYQDMEGERKYYYAKSRYDLPTEVREWADINTDEEIGPKNLMLVVMNDGPNYDDGMSFDEIANIIDTEWRKL